MDDQNKRPDDMNDFLYGPDNRKSEDRDRPSREDAQNTYRNASGGDGSGDPYQGARSDNEPYTFGPFGGAASYSTDPSQRRDEPQRTEVVQSSREYRPFTVTGGGRGGASWQPAPRRTSFRAMFASFMVGVLVIGGLMFTADRYNWFQPEVAASPVQSSVAKTVNNPVNSMPDGIRPNNIAQIFDQSSPAVVKIETSVKARSRSNSSMDDLFEQFFGQTPRSQSGQGDEGTLQPSGMGSGFIFDSTGYILTNQHVVADSDEIEVTVVGHNKPFKAKLLGNSYDLDLAVLKIEGSEFPTLKLGDSNDTSIGDWVVAIGNPYGFDHTVTVGVLSSTEREIPISDSNGTRNYQHLLQTDASINPGNSGGPLLNLAGEVIGINTAVSTQAQGIGFAIPTSTITEVLDNLKNNKEIPKKPEPFIGATLMTLTDEYAEKLGIKGTTGSLVREVIYGSPAYKADLRAYDVITGMDGESYKDNTSLIAVIQKKSVGDKVTLNAIRNGQKVELTVEIGDKNQFQAIE